MAPGQARAPRASDDEISEDAGATAVADEAPERNRPAYLRAASVDEVSVQTPTIVNAIFRECFRADGLPVPDELDSQQQIINKEVAHAIRDIGDRLARETALNNMISNVVVTKDTAFNTFLQVAKSIFEDGIVNWGRIVTLFYFGYKLAVKVIFEVPLIKMIIEWVCKYIKDQLVDWIFQQGGWVSSLQLFINSASLSSLRQGL